MLQPTEIIMLSVLTIQNEKIGQKEKYVLAGRAVVNSTSHVLNVKRAAVSCRLHYRLISSMFQRRDLP